jgi:hypothetical protein
MHNSPETKAIRQRMEEVRCDLDEDVQEIVEGARHMREWRTYVRSYPWVSLGTALAVGYLIVPRVLRVKPDARMVAELAKQSRQLATSKLSPQGKTRKVLLAFAGNLMMRGVSSLVAQQAGKLFASQTAKSSQDDQP